MKKGEQYDLILDAAHFTDYRIKRMARGTDRTLTQRDFSFAWPGKGFILDSGVAGVTFRARGPRSLIAATNLEVGQPPAGAGLR